MAILPTNTELINNKNFNSFIESFFPTAIKSISCKYTSSNIILRSYTDYNLDKSFNNIFILKDNKMNFISNISLEMNTFDLIYFELKKEYKFQISYTCDLPGLNINIIDSAGTVEFFKKSNQSEENSNDLGLTNSGFGILYFLAETPGIKPFISISDIYYMMYDNKYTLKNAKLNKYLIDGDLLKNNTTDYTNMITQHIKDIQARIDVVPTMSSVSNPIPKQNFNKIIYGIIFGIILMIIIIYMTILK